MHKGGGENFKCGHPQAPNQAYVQIHFTVSLSSVIRPENKQNP